MISSLRLPFQHQQQVAAAVERAKQVTMTELNAIIGVSSFFERFIKNVERLIKDAIHITSIVSFQKSPVITFKSRLRAQSQNLCNVAAILMFGFLICSVHKNSRRGK